MTVAILLAPATRVGYLLYPVDFFVWAWLLRSEDTVDPGPDPDGDVRSPVPAGAGVWDEPAGSHHDDHDRDRPTGHDGSFSERDGAGGADSAGSDRSHVLTAASTPAGISPDPTPSTAVA